MKRWGRVALTFALLLTVVWSVRAAYLFRVYHMARIWANLPNVTPPVGAFFAPNAWATTRHGSYADVVFLRISMGDRAGAFASATGNVPDNTSLATDGCDGNTWRRNLPPRILPHNLAACYGVAEAFDAPSRTPVSRVIEAGRGGTVWEGDADTLYITAYQMR